MQWFLEEEQVVRLHRFHNRRGCGQIPSSYRAVAHMTIQHYLDLFANMGADELQFLSFKISCFIG